jgi:hypothetical protein
MRKLVFIILIFVIILSDSTKASSFSMILKPLFGLYQPTSTPLKDYYTKNFIFTYGGEVEVLLPFYNLGMFFKIQSYTLDIYESVYERDITESAIWYTGGIMKEIDFEGVSLFSKVGISYHSDELALIKTENSRWGFQIGAGMKRKISETVRFFLEANFDYEKLTIPDYRTFAYSRHNAFLSGQNFNTGGILFLLGVEFKVL